MAHKKAKAQTLEASQGTQHQKSTTRNGITGKQRLFSQELHAAIRRVETKRGTRLVDHLVNMAFEDKQVLMVVAKKILPDLKHVENTGEVDHNVNISWGGGSPAFAPNQMGIEGSSGAAIAQDTQKAIDGPLPAAEDGRGEASNGGVAALHPTPTKEEMSASLNYKSSQGEAITLDASYTVIEDENSEYKDFED